MRYLVNYSTATFSLQNTAYVNAVVVVRVLVVVVGSAP
ncbi:ilvB operon leader peptide IvbL [Yersinia intermedia]|nr:ilvB operon leader peptide IvbL [Yersinia intermedia]PNM23680.1 ilvB operon leader peptide IvbL [Yersinia enterocolitica]